MAGEQTERRKVMKDMKIIGLKIKNIAGIEAFELAPDPGDHIVIGGPNAAGKSTVLNAIAAALGGKTHRPRRPVKDGAEEGETVVDLGDIVVKWRAKAGGREYLEVTSKDGATFRSPQSMLSKLWGDRTFDPLAFFGADPRAQVDHFAKLVGADLGSFDTKIHRLTAERRDIGRDAKKAQGAADSATCYDDAPETQVDTKALVKELTRRREYNDMTAMLAREIAHLEANADVADKTALSQIDQHNEGIEHIEKSTAEEVSRLRDKIESLEREIELAEKSIKDKIQNKNELIADHYDSIEQLESDRDIDTARRAEEIEEKRREFESRERKDDKEVTEAIYGADEQNAKHRANAKASVLKDTADELKKLYAEKTDEIDKVKSERAVTIEAAPIPIDGLGVDGSILTYRGRPIEQCSTAEKLKIWFALCLAEDPAIRIMPIDRWQDLDGESRALVKSMADEAGVQIWTTVVGEDDSDITVVIRDGHMVDS
jgi:hypothetical protein